jgi:hypothetical protein
MLKYILFCSSPFFLSTHLQAQSSLLNEGMSIQVQAGTNLRVASGEIQNNGTLNNRGNVYVGQNFAQNASGAYLSTATAWLWFMGTANQTIQSVNSLTISNLRISNNNKLQAQNNLTISNQLHFSTNSKLELGNFSLDIPSGNFTGYNTNAYIVTNGTGVVQTAFAAGDIKEIPVGNSTYNPVILLSNSGATDNFSFRVEDAVYTNGTSGAPLTQRAVNRTWHINESVTGGNDMDISLEWDAAQELASFARANSSIMHWDGAVWDFGAYMAALNAGGTRWGQTRSAVTNFSPFSVSSTVASFPIELSKFTAERQTADLVALDWLTQTETNNDRFEVERMLESETAFSKIGSLAGQGTSTRPHTYKFLDKNNTTQVSYYRLKQVDSNGDFSYSNVCAVQGDANAQQAQVFPNPAKNILYLRASFDTPTEATLFIQNMQGQTLWTTQQIFQPNQLISIDVLEKLEVGAYLLVVHPKNSIPKIHKFVKTK